MEKPNILIVEDNTIIAADLASKIEQMGFNVIGTAATAEEAIDWASQFCPQLVLMCVQLDGESDSIKAASTIHELCDKTFVVFLAARRQTAAIDAGELRGPYCVVSRPFMMSDLCFHIKTLLKM